MPEVMQFTYSSNFGPNCNVAARIAVLKLPDSDVIIWENFHSSPEFRLESWDAQAMQFVVDPGDAWQQRAANQANEDGLAVNPYHFVVHSTSHRYTLRQWTEDTNSAVGGHYTTGQEVTGDLQRAIAHQTFPLVPYGNLGNWQKIDTGKPVP